MKEKNQNNMSDEEPIGLVVYKPEEEVFQRLPLCKYLSELPEIIEEEPKDSGSEKRD